MLKKQKEIIKADERLRSVAIIMDGNGRWAKKRLLPRTKGHEKGAAIIEDVLSVFKEIGVHYVTLYAFSTENWKRPKEEVDAIMKLAYKYVDKVYMDRLKGEKSLAVRFIGDKNGLPEKLREKCIEIENMEKDSEFVCNIALNYGGRAEITNAANELVKKGLPITEENLSREMYTKDTPDPDLIIRTGGDFRISNFLIWQGAYSEYMILDTLWPDFGREDIEKCVKDFYKRKRRFGGLDKEDESPK
ncbi:MAG: di-trans,poly-cis-decaprenylcistransferase [Clostridia bacterium]|nr:di-trans,poly-cis-decaprenylcistransferase [Clostridia bacterium]